MLLVEATINSTLHRVSFEGAALTNWWSNRVCGMDAPQRAITCDHGGYCKPVFGDIEFFPDLFESDWPPPESIDLSLYYADPDDADPEGDKELVFSGTGQREENGRVGIKYGLYRPEYDETIADATSYNDTLVNVITTILTGIAEISTVNTTKARASSPAVKFTVSGQQLAINLASDICEFFGHFFYIDGSTAYLVDMLLDNETRTLTEFDFFPPKYEDHTKVAMVSATSGGTVYTRSSSYSHGSKMTVTPYHDTQVNIEAALDDILTIENRSRFSIPMPLAGDLPLPGEKISWPDTSLGQDSEAWIRARIFRFDFINEVVTIEGEGALTAA
jgi:hypothetical protein